MKACTPDVEVGGASAQVAFSGVKQSQDPNVVSVTIGSKCFPTTPRGEQPALYDLDNTGPASATASQFKTTSCNTFYTSAIASIGSNAYNTAEKSGVTPKDVRKVPKFDDVTFSGLASMADAMHDFKVKSSKNQDKDLQASVTKNCKGEDP